MEGADNRVQTATVADGAGIENPASVRGFRYPWASTWPPDGLPSRWRRASVGRRLRLCARAALLLVPLLAAGALAIRLSHQEAGGSPHRDVQIDGRVPATLYVPGRLDGITQDLPQPLPAGQRPPVIVLAHGHSADRALMSPLARRLVTAGFAVVTFDFRGHGESRIPFSAGGSSGLEGLRDDLGTVVDWVEQLSYVDSRRLVLMGHSLGSAAVVDFATRDDRPVAVIAMSGSVSPLEGSRRPRNLLLMVAERDAGAVRDEARRTAGHVIGMDARFDRTYGDVRLGTAIGLAEVPSTDHLTILYSDQTVRRAVAWINASTAMRSEPGNGRPDPRLRTAGLYLLFALMLIAWVGRFVGRLTPPAMEVAVAAVPRRLAALALALVVPLPFLAVGDPGAFLMLDAGGALAAHFAAAGVVLLAARRRGTDGPRQQGGSVHAPGYSRPVATAGAGLIGPAVIGWSAIYVLLTPLGPVFHRLVPTPPRAIAAAGVALLTLPFFVGLEGSLRRGRTVVAAFWSAIGRVIIVAVVAAGAFVGLLPGMVVLYLPILIVVFVVFEVLAAGIYGGSREPRVVAAVEAGVFGWLVAVTAPFSG